MDWGFVKVRDYSGLEYQAACFAMICHHCGMKYIGFFPNAKQENLFIGMIHEFQYTLSSEGLLLSLLRTMQGLQLQATMIMQILF